MKRSKEINVFNIAFLDLLSGALGAVIILFIAVPKAKKEIKEKEVSPTVVKVEKKKEIKKTPRTPSSVVLEQKEKMERLKKMLKTQNQVIKDLKSHQQKVEEELAESKKENEELKLEAKEKKISQNSNAQNNFAPSLTSQKSIDVGFKFKGKKILFIIDTSGSMIQEERISHVKAGLKMLITSMSTDFQVDVVSFPSQDGKESYTEHWGMLKKPTTRNKTLLFRHLYSLMPRGRTPTRDVLRFAFKRYKHLTDIVLLTDGVPTASGTGKPDDVYGILSEVARLNTYGVQINAIGVGSDFVRRKENKAYQFLDRLTKENSGFFVGF